MEEFIKTMRVFIMCVLYLTISTGIVAAGAFQGEAVQAGVASNCEKKHGEIVKSLLCAAESGDSKAQCDLGNAYYRGKGVKRDIVKAVEWWRKAAISGNAIAQFNLGIAYATGKGVNRDMGEAFKWCFKAVFAFLLSTDNAHVVDNQQI